MATIKLSQDDAQFLRELKNELLTQPNDGNADPIMKMPHRRLQFPWLVTRGNAVHARLYVWENKSY